MSYGTKFKGRLTISPPLDTLETYNVREFVKKRHDDGWRLKGEKIATYAPSIWCPFTATEDGSALVWNKNESVSQPIMWLNLLISTFILPGNHNVSGTLIARGERFDDIWHVVMDEMSAATRVDGWPSNFKSL